MSDSPQPQWEAPTWASHLLAALFWFDFGFKIIPVRPGTKATAARWDEWLSRLSRSRIISHWRQHPADEVGFIVGDNIVVFDADTPEALAALLAAEVRSGVTPLLVVRTRRGEHHYFSRDAGSLSLPSARDFPKNLDVKTGRTMVVLPPSTGKIIVKMGASQMIKHASELSAATNALIDALTGGSRRTPAPTASRPAPQAPEVPPASMPLLQACVNRLDADLPRGDWFRVAAVLFHETAGGKDGYDLFDSWSATGHKYKGAHETQILWKSLDLDHPSPPTIATLRFMLKAEGISWAEIQDAAEEQFQAVVDAEGTR